LIATFSCLKRAFGIPRAHPCSSGNETNYHSPIERSLQRCLPIIVNTIHVGIGCNETDTPNTQQHRTNVSTHFTIARACFQINVTFEHFHNRLNIGIVFDVEIGPMRKQHTKHVGTLGANNSKTSNLPVSRRRSRCAHQRSKAFQQTQGINATRFGTSPRARAAAD
jgi:hypothetical protein